MRIGIVDYKAGNSQSVAAAVKAIGGRYTLVRTPQDLGEVDAVILPGVGSAGATMDSLRALDLIEPLGQFVIEEKRHYLGICVGLQLLFERSEEDSASCLGWFGGEVRRFNGEVVRVPQIGWNNLTPSRQHPIFSGLENELYGYFVNSYHAFPADEDVVLARTDYDGNSTAIVARDNIWATQFHVEKSGSVGLQMMRNFVKEVESC